MTNFSITDILANLDSLSFDDMILLLQVLDKKISSIVDEMEKDFIQRADEIICN